MLPVLLVVWIVLAVSLAFFVAAVAVAATRGLQAWRTFRAVSGTLGAALEDFARRAEATGTHAAAAAEGTAKLTASVLRLQRSLATFAVLQAALGEPSALIAGVRGLVPRK
jgi:hypothetical protein